MNEEVKELAHELNRKISRLHLILEQCRQLYSNTETISILNKTAGLFFNIVQSQFVDALLLGICRLTDNEKIGRNKNVSINSICLLIQDDQFKEEVSILCKQAVLESKFARDHRNKRISHSDQDYYKTRESSPLDTATFAKIENSLKTIGAVIGLVFSRLLKTTIVYKLTRIGRRTCWKIKETRYAGSVELRNH